MVRFIAPLRRLVGPNRPPYDEFMRRCHDLMKEDIDFQENTAKQYWEFAPNSSWLVITDCVSHAVLSGHYALEQTFLIPEDALVLPQRSPLAILERVLGRRLTL
jgi:3-deoxy-D-manno-oct-2-ulosonic acid (Kdo) hydroxylase